MTESRARGAVLTLNPSTEAVVVKSGHWLSSRAILSALSQSRMRRTSQGVRSGALAGGSRPASAYSGASAPLRRVSEFGVDVILQLGDQRTAVIGRNPENPEQAEEIVVGSEVQVDQPARILKPNHRISQTIGVIVQANVICVRVKPGDHLRLVNGRSLS